MERAPKFCLPDKNDSRHCLDDYAGKWIVLYFYPKDNTSGCTREALDFTEMKDAFEKEGAMIIGISPDSTKSHDKFIEKHNLDILLLSDIEKEVMKEYGVWQLKKNYGREYMGVVRSTFLINPEGEIVEKWEKVRVNGHVEKVIERLKDARG